MWGNETSYCHQDSNSDPLVVQPVASRYTNYNIPALTTTKPHIEMSVRLIATVERKDPGKERKMILWQTIWDE
jgi:hypothetical protein